MVALAVVTWQLGALARSEPARARWLILTLVVTFATNAALSQAYFFAAPTMFGIAIVAAHLAALSLSRAR